MPEYKTGKEGRPKKSEAIDYFEVQVVGYARTLPVADARRFLRGLLESAHGEAFPKMRLAYTNFCLADDQFESIAHPQGVLALDRKERAS